MSFKEAMEDTPWTIGGSIPIGIGGSKPTPPPSTPPSPAPTGGSQVVSVSQSDFDVYFDGSSKNWLAGPGTIYGGNPAWDLNGDGIFQKREADHWWLYGKGVGVRVDNSKIDWTGLTIPKGYKNGDQFAISTTDAFLKLPLETAATYGGTSFVVVNSSEVRVIDQPYHYNYRPNNSYENVRRNFLTLAGSPVGSLFMKGVDFKIYYDNPNIKIK